jgi:nucleotide-binding universal stress UspA family protein
VRPTSESVIARTADDGPLVICYDGSKHAAQAIDFTGSLVPGASALVVTVWTPILQALTAVTLGPAPPISDPVEADAAQRRSAEQIASGRVWEAIERTAREHEGLLIVCGARRSGALSAVVDNVSGALVHNAARPVLVVPSSQAISERLRDPVE